MTRPSCQVCGNYQDQPNSWHWKGCRNVPTRPRIEINEINFFALPAGYDGCSQRPFPPPTPLLSNSSRFNR